MTYEKINSSGLETAKNNGAMNPQEEIRHLRESLKQAENVQAELDLRAFNLKTLYDVSKDIYGTVESETIIRNFLLMTMGNFGVMDGFVLLQDESSETDGQFVAIGFQDENHDVLENASIRLLELPQTASEPIDPLSSKHDRSFPESVNLLLPFDVGPDSPGLLGLGAKLIGEPYNENDIELLDTLVNNLVIALKNARSFAQARKLNKSLKLQNIELEKAFDELRKAMHKVEILESVKASLTKFVPATVSRMIEKSPNGEMPESKEKDVSILFLDIEAYTKICERLGDAEMNDIIEKHFSAFMDAIYANNGDVNETAGDGLMVLFLDKDKGQNAIDAVRTALQIREDTLRIGEECTTLYRPLEINMGINSGFAYVGAAKFDSLIGSRWTYTARGGITNVAARIGAQAKGGKVFLSKTTAQRIKDQFSLSPLGKFNLKNVTEEVEIYEI
jgi:class 3 adenylate cyclase